MAKGYHILRLIRRAQIADSVNLAVSEDTIGRSGFATRGWTLTNQAREKGPIFLGEGENSIKVTYDPMVAHKETQTKRRIKRECQDGGEIGDGSPRGDIQNTAKLGANLVEEKLLFAGQKKLIT